MIYTIGGVPVLRYSRAAADAIQIESAPRLGVELALQSTTTIPFSSVNTASARPRTTTPSTTISNGIEILTHYC